MKDIIKANTSFIFVTMALVFFTWAMNNGKGGAVQAIYNMKTVVQTVLVLISTKKLPSALEFGGLALGLIGVIIIVIQKKDAKKEEELQETED